LSEKLGITARTAFAKAVREKTAQFYPDGNNRVTSTYWRRHRALRGQADGAACRTVATFEAFGLSEKLVRER
jgi:hypothetical protein